ncbi:substrate-binding domain-containing protein [Galactobacillus timonensis]|uniref:sugar ABC transporter substrate-binding protein n=1 Tax=Galactobacillus timonensis TaxID=2041840 RepID=UPI00240A5C48|nr:substrate-binding domain-containing protein [Galactobacillus timonensis]MDD6681456.1 substrate-binding domain-containing protein [Galactobacillus timonensis]
MRFEKAVQAVENCTAFRFFKRSTMKKHICLLAMIAAIFSLCGCGFQPPASKYQTNNVTRVTVILPHEDDIYWGDVKRGIEDHIEECEQWNIDIQVQIPQLNYNISQMTQLINRAIAARTDVIVVQGTQDKDFVSSMREAISQGIQVICIDTDVDSDSLPEHLYIGSDNYAAGQMMGDHLAQLMHGRGSVSIMSGAEGYPNLEQRIKGIESVIERYDGMVLSEIVYDHYDALTAVEVYHSLQSGSALACIEGTGAAAIEKVLTSSDQKFSYIVGFDNSSTISEGIVNGIIKQDQYGIGQKLVEQLIYYQMHGNFEASEIYTKFEWVDASNEQEAE